MDSGNLKLPEGYSLDYGDADYMRLCNESGRVVAEYTSDEDEEVIVKIAWFQKNHADANERAYTQLINGAREVKAKA